MSQQQGESQEEGSIFTRTWEFDPKEEEDFETDADPNESQDETSTDSDDIDNGMIMTEPGDGKRGDRGGRQPPRKRIRGSSTSAIETEWTVGTDYSTKWERKLEGLKRPRHEVLDLGEVKRRKEKLEKVAGKEAVAGKSLPLSSQPTLTSSTWLTPTAHSAHAEACDKMLIRVGQVDIQNAWLDKIGRLLYSVKVFRSLNGAQTIADSNVADFRTPGQVDYFNRMFDYKETRLLPPPQRLVRPNPKSFLPRIGEGSFKIGYYERVCGMSEKRGENTINCLETMRERDGLGEDVGELPARSWNARDYLFRQSVKENGEVTVSMSCRKKDGTGKLRKIRIWDYVGQTRQPNGFIARVSGHMSTSKGTSQIPPKGDPDSTTVLPKREPNPSKEYTGEFYSLAEPIRQTSFGRLFFGEDCFILNHGSLIAPVSLAFEEDRDGCIAVARKDEYLASNRLFGCQKWYSYGYGTASSSKQGFQINSLSRGVMGGTLNLKKELWGEAWQTDGDVTKTFALRPFFIEADESWTSQVVVKSRRVVEGVSSVTRIVELSEIENVIDYTKLELKMAAYRYFVLLLHEDENEGIGMEILCTNGLSERVVLQMELELLKWEFDKNEDARHHRKRELEFKTVQGGLENKVPLIWASGTLMPIITERTSIAGRISLKPLESAIDKLQSALEPGEIVDTIYFAHPYAQLQENGTWIIGFATRPQLKIKVNSVYWDNDARRNSFKEGCKSILDELKGT
ncbi:hypothetical protein JCM5353_003101 [Sporobolomyces roseus]